MADTPSLTEPTPADHQQMDRSNDPETTAQLDAEAAAAAMQSGRQRLTGSAVGVGSVAFDDPGAYDVGAGSDPQDDPVTDDLPPPGAPR
jgi:hypothetical protein